MKRLFTLLLALALLLSACAYGEDPALTGASSGAEETQTAAPTAAQPTEPDTQLTGEDPWQDPDDSEEDLDEEDTSEDLEYTDPEYTVPEYTEPETVEPEPTLPPEPIDWQVHTDWSHYRPYSGSGAQYTRLREGPLDHFEPSEDYGAVYPYVASVLYAESEQGYHYGTLRIFGLADGSGRILTDGIYRSVDVLDGGQENGAPLNRRYYVVSRSLGAETEIREAQGWTYTDIRPIVRCGLISMDGSFALDCVYTSIKKMDCGILCCESEKEPKFTLYNDEWEPILTGGDVFDATECDWWDLDYSDGLFYAYVWSYSGDPKAWFCDEAGKRVLGPYVDAGPFRDGLACVSEDGKRYGFIDKTGAWVVDPVYTYRNDFEDGRVLVRTEDDCFVVLDPTGREVLHSGPDDWISAAACGYLLEKGDTWNEKEYYDRDGNLLISGDWQLDCLDADTFVCAEEGKNHVLRLSPEETEIVLDEQYGVSKGVAELDGTLRFGYIVDVWTDSEEQYFIPEDLSCVLEYQAPSRSSPLYAMTNWSVVDAVTGEKWYYCWTETGWRGLSESGKQFLVPFSVSSLRPLGELICASDEKDSYLLTLAGEVVLYYPLIAAD
jgi:hypothetical protein